MASSTGGSGNDVFTFNVGGGASSVTDSGGVDIIKLGAGPTTSTVSYQRAGNDLVVTYGATDSITIYGQFLADSTGAYSHAVEKLQYSYGYQIDLLSGINLNMTGTAGSDTLYGWTGKDSINGGGGDDIIWGGTGASVLNGGAGNDSVYAGNAGNSLYGGGGNDLLVGGTGNDMLSGDGGIDTMIGGAGNDTYVVDVAADVVTEKAGEGIDTVQSSFNYTLGDNIENLTLTSAGNTNGTGNSLDNVIIGNSGANILNGAGGLDTLSGGSGADTYIIDNQGVTVIEAITGGIDTVQASVSYALGANVENLVLTGAADIAGTGNELSNVVTGNSGANVLDGGAGGTDTVSGGAGNDKLVFHVGQSAGTFAGNAGIDTLELAVSSAGVTDALRADVKGLVDWLGLQHAAYGSDAAMQAASSGASYTMSSLPLTVSTIEGVGVLLNGQEVSVADFINRAPDLDLAASTSALTLSHNAAAAAQLVASDFNGDALTFSLQQGPAHGTLTFTDTQGGYSYAAGDYVGTDSFTLKVDDGHGGFTTRTVAVNITNDAPVAANVAVAGVEDHPVSGTVVATDLENDKLSYSIANGPAHGSVALDAATGAFTFTGADNWSGDDVFTVAVNDGHGGITTSTVGVSLAAAADAPQLQLAQSFVVDPSQIIRAGDAGEKIVGGAGRDVIYGGAGDDTISGGGSGGSTGSITVGLDIQAALGDRDGSETLSVRVEGVPVGGQLSAGVLQQDGSWLLQQTDLANLSLTTPDTTPLNLTVTASSTEGSNHDVSTTTASISITPQTPAGQPGGSGVDEIHGGGGNDVIFGGKAADLLFGDAGNDTIKGDSGNDVIEGGAGDDLIFGGTGNDVLTGNDGNDTVQGGEGDDLIVAGAGDQMLHGGSGFDTLDFSKLSGKLYVDAGGHEAKLYAADGTVAHTYDLVSLEKIVGTDQGNLFDTSHTTGLAFIGGAGDDLFHIQGGNQTLTGGAGSDTYQWVRKFVAEGPQNGGGERITDFKVGEDHLDLSDFLKGQAIKNPQYSDVVRVHESSDGKGTIVQGLANGKWFDVAKLDGVHDAKLADLGLVDHWSQPFVG